MKSLKLQPTFTLELATSPADSMSRIRAVLREETSHDAFSEAVSAGNCIDVKVPQPQQRFWSPHLNAHVSEHERGSEIYCRFSPRPEIWTGVVAIYFIASFFMCCAAIYGSVQWAMDDSPWAFLLIPIGILMIAGVHIASLIGQKLSEDQMENLRTRLEQIVKQAGSRDSAAERGT